MNIESHYNEGADQTPYNIINLNRSRNAQRQIYKDEKFHDARCAKRLFCVPAPASHELKKGVMASFRHFTSRLQ